MNKQLTDTESRLKRLKFRAWHRGWKETDLILGRFADEKLTGLDTPALAQFEALLDQDDDIIWGWVVGKQAPDAEFADIIGLIQNHCGAL